MSTIGEYPIFKNGEEVPYLKNLRSYLAHAKIHKPAKVEYYQELINQWTKSKTMKQFLYTEKTRGESFTTWIDNIINQDHVKICHCCEQYINEGYEIKLPDGKVVYFCDDDCLELELSKEENSHILKAFEDNPDNKVSKYWWEINTDYDGKILQEFIHESQIGDIWENETDKYVRIN